MQKNLQHIHSFFRAFALFPSPIIEIEIEVSASSFLRSFNSSGVNLRVYPTFLNRIAIVFQKMFFYKLFVSKLYQYEQIDHRPVIYIDESGFSVDAVRDRGYSSIGARCYGGKDWHRRGRVIVIGAIHHFKILNICLFEGNINADVFYTWTVHQLLPSPPERTVIVADNAAFHKRTDCLKAITRHRNMNFYFCPHLNLLSKSGRRLRR